MLVTNGSQGKKHVLMEKVWNPQEKCYHYFQCYLLITQMKYFQKCQYVTMHLSCSLLNHNDSFLFISSKLSPCWNKNIGPERPNELQSGLCNRRSPYKSRRIQKCPQNSTHYQTRTTKHLLCQKTKLGCTVKNKN